MFANVSQVRVGALWSFADLGGAFGVPIPLGVFIPRNYIIDRFTVAVVLAPTSVGGTATIEFGKRTGAVDITNFFMVANAEANFVVDTVIPGIDFNANPAFVNLDPDVNAELTMTIGVEDLISGYLVLIAEMSSIDQLK